MIGGVVFTPPKAEATGFTFSSDYYRAQPGEPIQLSPNDYCPNITSPAGKQWVSGVFVDASSQVFSNLEVVTTLANGTWYSGILMIPNGASLGVGSLHLVCSDQPNMIGITQTYDAIAIGVTSQTSQFSVGRAQYGHSLPISSVVKCASNSKLFIEVVP